LIKDKPPHIKYAPKKANPKRKIKKITKYAYLDRRNILGELEGLEGLVGSYQRYGWNSKLSPISLVTGSKAAWPVGLANARR